MIKLTTSVWIVSLSLTFFGCGKPGETDSPTTDNTSNFDEHGAFDLLPADPNAAWRTSNLPGCVEFRNKCTNAPRTPAAGDFLDLGRKIIELTTKLNSTDKAILGCASDSTKRVLSLAAQCQDGRCVDSVIGGYNAAAQVSCTVAKCLASIRPEAALMTSVCDLGNKLAKNIECFGAPGLGMGLAGLCDTELRNNRPIVLQPCTRTTSVQACSNGSAANPSDIEIGCFRAVNNLKNQNMINEFQLGSCARRCIEMTTSASQSCNRVCTPNQSSTQSCSVSNGSGSQTRTCNSQGTGFINGTCRATSCQSGFRLSGGACVAATSVCNPNQSSTQSCSVSNGSGSLTRTCNPQGTGFINGTCRVTSCASGFTLNNGTCTANTQPSSGSLLCAVAHTISNTSSCPSGTSFVRCVGSLCEQIVCRGPATTVTSCDQCQSPRRCGAPGSYLFP
jgi:hypothetical protein